MKNKLELSKMRDWYKPKVWVNDFVNNLGVYKYQKEDLLSENEIRSSIKEFFDEFKKTLIENPFLTKDKQSLNLCSAYVEYVVTYEDYLYEVFKAFWKVYCLKIKPKEDGLEEKRNQFMQSIYERVNNFHKQNFLGYFFYFEKIESKEDKTDLLQDIILLKNDYYHIAQQMSSEFRPFISLLEVSIDKITRPDLKLKGEDLSKYKMVVGLIEYLERHQNEIYKFRQGWQKWACKIAIVKDSAFVRWKSRNEDDVNNIKSNLTEADFIKLDKLWRKFHPEINLKAFHPKVG